MTARFVAVLVDSCVWSLALRRKSPVDAVARSLRDLIQDGRTRMIGPIRQEVLSGIRDQEQFARLRDLLASFPDLTLTTRDYESAAECFNRCQAKGNAGSHTDFLMCAVAKERKLAIMTTDGDFARYSRVLGLSLFSVGT